jgi:magnesium-transporting ATPase (P-type)
MPKRPATGQPSRPTRAVPDAALHHLPAHEVLLLLETDRTQGLTADEAAKRLERFGPNVLPSFRRHGPLIRFLFQFHHPLIYILLAATAITAFLGEWVDSAVIFGVVLVNAVVGFIQEDRAEKSLDALVAMVKTEAAVVREELKGSDPFPSIQTANGG